MAMGNAAEVREGDVVEAEDGKHAAEHHIIKNLINDIKLKHLYAMPQRVRKKKNKLKKFNEALDNMMTNCYSPAKIKPTIAGKDQADQGPQHIGKDPATGQAPQGRGAKVQ